MPLAGSTPVVSAMAIILLVIMQIFWLQHPIETVKKPQIHTPLSEIQLMEALKDGHVVFFGREPSKQRLALAWSQVGLENGQGKEIYNFNLGNIGGSKKEPYFFLHGYPFKANESVRDGSVLYWKTINRMCSSVLPHFDVGDTKSAAYQLYRCGYYRADKDDYARGMNQLYWKALRLYGEK